MQEIKDEMSWRGLVRDERLIGINTDISVETVACKCRRDECNGSLVRDADPECELCKGTGYVLIQMATTRATRMQP